jgi:CheY-like chemotaxis protein
LKKVLLIEDNSDLRENVTEILQLEGFLVLIASNGKIGSEMALLELPDVILCDIMMPEMNGHEVFLKLKQEEKTKNIPFIYFTSDAEKKNIESSMARGADGYICKPFSESELLETIKHCLNSVPGKTNLS